MIPVGSDEREKSPNKKQNEDTEEEGLQQAGGALLTRMHAYTHAHLRNSSRLREMWDSAPPPSGLPPLSTMAKRKRDPHMMLV